MSDAYHLPPSSAEVKNGWSYISTPPVWFHGFCKDIVTFICTEYVNA
jgi:hypothetical protein